MATYATGSGQTYTTIADAIAAVTAAVGATPATESHRIQLSEGETFTENPDLPNFSACATTRKFPLIIETEPGYTTEAIINGEINMTTFGYVCYAEFHNVTITNSKLNLKNMDRGLTFRNVIAAFSDAGAWGVTENGVVAFLDGCKIDISQRLGWVTDYQIGWRIEDSEIRGTGTDVTALFLQTGSAGRMNVFARNSRFIGTGLGSVFSNSHVATNRTPGYFDIKQCTFKNFLSVVADLHAQNVVLENNIFDDITYVYHSKQTTGYEPYGISLTLEGNLYNNITSIIKSTSPATDYSGLSDILSGGWESEGNGSEASPGFVSTTWGNADFLKLSASLATSKNVGVYDDFDGTARLKYSDIDPGAHQFAAAEETGISQSDAPTALTITDTGDGITHTVTATGATAGAAIRLYSHADDSLIAIVDASGKTADLTAGQSLYAKALEDGKTLSERYPAAAGVDVPVLASVAQADAPTLSAAVAGDGQVTLTLALNDAGDPAYAIWHALTGDWTTPSDSFKVTADGTLVVTGLTNATRYQFAAVSKNGDVYSLPSEALEATPQGADVLSLEGALLVLLASNATLATALGTRMYPALAPQNAAAPLLVYTRITGEHTRALHNATGQATVRMQIDVYSDSYATAKSLSDAIRVTLDGYRGTVASGDKTLALSSCTLMSERDGFDNPVTGKERGTYRVIHEYEILHTEAIRVL